MSETSKHTGPILEHAGRRVRRPGSRRQLWILAFVLIVAGGAVTVSVFFINQQDAPYRLQSYQTSTVARTNIVDTVEVGGTVRVRNESTVRAPVQGILEAVLVDVGEPVQAGEVIARIDAEELRTQITATEQQVSAAERTLAVLRLTWEQELIGARQQRRALATALGNAETELSNTRSMLAAGSVSAAAVTEAEEAAESARLALEDHDESRTLAMQLHELELEASESNIEQLKSELVDQQTALEETRIRAPITGRVIWTVDLVTAVGEQIAEQAAILRIADTRDPFVESSIEEQYVGDLEVGQPASLTVGGQPLSGAIERIGLLAQAPPDGGVPTVDLDISVDASGEEVLTGTTALAELVLGEIPDALVLPRGPFFVTGNRITLFVVEGGIARRTPVTFGLVTPDYVQILTGVSEGDVVITSSYQDYIDEPFVELGGRE